jgi:hypothetical protein
MSSLILPSFSKDTPNKIGQNIDVSGKHTLIKTTGSIYGDWNVAIADEPIDANSDGTKMFCFRVENAGLYSAVVFGFTPMETFDSTKQGFFGWNGLTGVGSDLRNGDLWYPVDAEHDIVYLKISRRAKEIIVILEISNNGKKKEIRFVHDGKETITSDVSEHLKGDLLFPAICLWENNQQITIIPIDQIKIRTPAVERLLCEENISYGVEVETKKENKEKKVKQVATKKTKKETKPKTTKATKNKEEKKNNKEKKPKAKK